LWGEEEDLAEGLPFRATSFLHITLYHKVTGVISRVLGNRVQDWFWEVSCFPFTSLRGERSTDRSQNHGMLWVGRHL